MAHIAFVGHAVWDHTFHVPALSARPGKTQATAYHGGIGGMSANAACAAQALRGPDSPEVVLATALGDDPPGQALQQALQSRGVRLHPGAVLPTARTSVSAVLVDGHGERQAHNFRGDAFVRAPLPDASLLRDCKCVQADPRWPNAAAWALREAAALGCVALLDADVAPTEVLRELLPLANWAVFSSDGLLAWADAADPTGTCAAAEPALQTHFAEACAARPHAHLVVTRGAQGAWWRAPGASVVELPTHPVRSVNTNGAGDAMHGALLLALAEGLPPSVALRQAMASGALACTGAALSREAVAAMLKETQR